MKEEYKTGDTVNISVEVKNDGELAGDEVVQVYISDLNTHVPVPIRSLKGFKRIHLQPGETQTVEFNISPEAFSIINDNNERLIIPGRFNVSVGGGQPDSKGTEEGVNLLRKEIRIGT